MILDKTDKGRRQGGREGGRAHCDGRGDLDQFEQLVCVLHVVCP